MSSPNRGLDCESGRTWLVFVVTCVSVATGVWAGDSTGARLPRQAQTHEFSDRAAKIRPGLADEDQLAIVPALFERAAKGPGGSRAA